MLVALPIIAGFGSTAVLAAYHATYGVRSQWLGPTVWRARTDTNEVALTFVPGWRSRGKREGERLMLL